ncbi:MAG: NYN domain-containing protein [Pseudomonadota bacterium]
MASTGPTVEPKVAVFIDFENLALGAKDTPQGTFDIQLVLKRLLEKGRLVYKRAYSDWSRYRQYTRAFHEHGIELIDIPQTKISGKNSADIRMVVDALDLCYAKQHIDVFALVSGDSDFSPLVSKLKENDKRVVGCGIKSSTSDLLIANCDEFIYYDDLARAAGRSKKTAKKRTSQKADRRDELMDLIAEIVSSLESDYTPLWGSLVKQTLRRVHPGFTESYYDFKSFSELLKEAEKRKVIRLDYDESRGNYSVTSY